MKERKIDQVATSYLGIMLTKKVGNLNKHIKETESKASRILREINGISSKQNVGEEEIRVKIELFETCLAPAILYGFEASMALGQNTKVRWKQQKKIQNQSLKKTLQLPVTTGFYNTFHQIANGDRYMASKGENRILNSDVNPQYN